MSQEKLKQAKQLIQQKQYVQAKALLESIDHPTAEKWILQIDEQLWSASEQAQGDIPLKRTPIKPATVQEIIVTTTDLPYDYDVISPIYFQVSNKGLFSSSLGKLKKKYADELDAMKKKKVMGSGELDLGFIWYGEFSIGQNDFEAAFYVATRELQNRALQMKADAVVGMRQDIDLDTSGWQFFYLQMYGTAVRFR